MFASQHSGLTAAVAEVAAEDRDGWSGAARSDRLLELLAARERLEAEVLRLVGEWDASAAWAEDGAGSAPAWLAHHAPVTKAEAARLVRSARLAHRHERTGKLLAAGDVTTAHVDVLARAVRHREDLYPEHEEVLLDTARALRPEVFRHAARRWRCLADDALADNDAYDAFQRRRLHCSTTFQGSLAGDFELDPEGGATVLAALDAYDTPDPVGVAGGPRSLAQRRADILVTLMGEALARATPARRAQVGIDVVIDLDTLAGRAPADLMQARCELGRMGPVARSTVERLACDAAIGRAVMRGHSEVLDLGRRTRSVTASQRRALAIRDRGCVEIGCEVPAEWCDAHHRQHWLHDGPSDLGNLELRCRRHHVDQHEGRHRGRPPPGALRKPQVRATSLTS